MPARSRAADPPWLDPANLEALTARFAPPDATQVQQLALALEHSTTPVEHLILSLVAAGLAPTAAWQRLCVRGERPGLEAARSATGSGSEAAAALQAAATSYVLHPGDDEQAASAIVARVGWSRVRARWFLSVNHDTLGQRADTPAAGRRADI